MNMTYCHLVMGYVMYEGGSNKMKFSSGVWVSVLGTHLQQWTSWHCCERLCLASVSFFLTTRQVCPFHERCFTSTPAHTTLSVQQCLTKNHMTPMLYPPCLPDLSLRDFLFVSLDEKSPQRETFCGCGRGETTMTTKWQKHQNALKSTSSKTVLSSGKKVSE